MAIMANVYSGGMLYKYPVNMNNNYTLMDSVGVAIHYMSCTLISI